MIADPTAPRPRPHHYMNADGFCHAGDMFESGTEYVVLYSAEELARIVNAEKAEAWDQGYRIGVPAVRRGDTNPYRYTTPPTDAAEAAGGADHG